MRLSFTRRLFGTLTSGFGIQFSIAMVLCVVGVFALAFWAFFGIDDFPESEWPTAISTHTTVVVLATSDDAGVAKEICQSVAGECNDSSHILLMGSAKTLLTSRYRFWVQGVMEEDPAQFISLKLSKHRLESALTVLIREDRSGKVKKLIWESGQ